MDKIGHHVADEGSETLLGDNDVPMMPELDFVPVLGIETTWSNGESSLAMISLRGVTHTMVNSRSMTLYHVMRGEGAMVTNGVVEYLKPRVIAEVPAGTPYYFEGNVDMKAISTPPFDPADVEVID